MSFCLNSPAGSHVTLAGVGYLCNMTAPMWITLEEDFIKMSDTSLEREAVADRFEEQ